MKLAQRIIEMSVPYENQVIDAFNDRIRQLGYIESVSVIDFDEDSVIFYDNEDELTVDFYAVIDDYGLPYGVAVIDYEEDGKEDFREIDLPDNITFEKDKYSDSYKINLLDLKWLDEEILLEMLLGSEDLEERYTYVVRNGKKVKKKLVKAKRRRIKSAAQRQGYKKAARKRKAKKGAINRQRKKSLRLRKRTNLKSNKGKKFKVQGTSSRL